MTSWARRRPRLALFAAALALRAACLAAVSGLSGIPARDLALFFDGHLYILIAGTLPRLYGGVHAFFPAFPKPDAYITAWFPAYPFLIAAARVLLRDWRLAALAVSQACAAGAVVVAYELARPLVGRPAAAAALFLFLPPAWLLCGSLAFVEPLYVLLFAGAVCLQLRGRRGWALTAAAAAMVTQKSGLLLLPILAFGDGALRRPGRARAVLGYAAAAVPAALLQAWLWRLFGDPLVNVHIHERIFGGAYFGWPLAAFFSWLANPAQPFRGLLLARKAAIAASLLFYALPLSWGLRRKRLRPLAVWLMVVLGFNASLTGVSAFYAFPRFMLAAAPAAVVLWTARLEDALPRAWLLLALAPAALAFDAVEALGQLDLAVRYWGPGYFRLLADWLRLR